MRREGFELTVGKPQVVTREIDGVVHEPMENMTIDAPEEYMGAITQLMAARKGTMNTMSNNGTGWSAWSSCPGPRPHRLPHHLPDRDPRRGHRLLLRGRLRAVEGEIEYRSSGSLVADRAGTATPFAMINLQERGTFFVDPQEEVYEGMVVGENSRNEDMEVNITKEKKLTNMRAASADSFEGLTPPTQLTLEESLEFANEDECVEVTPESIRIRKVILNASDRLKESRKKKSAAQS